MDSSNVSNVSIFTRFILFVTMALVTVLTIYPIFWVIMQSFRSHVAFSFDRLGWPMSTNFENNIFTFSFALDFRNYLFVWNQWNLPRFFQNSLIYSIVTVLVIVLFSNMAGFAFAKLDFKITKVLLGLFIVGILLTIQSILIPIFLMVHTVGLFNTRLGVLIPYIGLGLPMAIYLNTDYVKKGIPDELIESAKIDGAGFLKIFWRIIFPLSTPVSVTIAIITFIATWNEFIIMNILTSGDTYRSLPALVGRFTSARGSNFGALFTGLSLSMVPMLIFYFIFRNKITQGVAAGAVKG